MSEDALWSIVRQHLSPYGWTHRIENRIAVGTPDFLFVLLQVMGVCEMKHVPSWPKKEATKIIIPSMKLEQVLWMEKWVGLGGNGWTLLQISKTYFLLEGKYSRLLLDGTSKSNLFDIASVYKLGEFPGKDIVKCMTLRI